MGEILHRCSFCSAGFKTESRFIKHKCSAMVRDGEFKSPMGQAAWSFYKDWMMKKYFSASTAASTFKTSRYFNAFYKFSKFVRQAQIPNTKIYIDLMLRLKIDPTLWSRDEAYRRYLEYYTRKVPVKELANSSISTMLNIADAFEVDVSEIFDYLEPNDVITLLRQRNLSPWVLLNSKKFTNFYINITTSEERIIMETIINPDYWVKRFEKNIEDVKLVKSYIKELGL